MEEFLQAINPFLTLGSIIASYYVIKHTRTKGKMGVNVDALVEAPKCPKCSTKLPRVRIPRTLNEVLFGGWTCPKCRSRFDKWMRPQGD
jgi:uncharacterized protein with PIN domain